MVVEITNTPKLVVISLDDDELEEEPEEDPKEDQEEHLELGEHQADHGVKDTKLGVSQDNYDSSEEPGDEFDSHYDPSGNC